MNKEAAVFLITLMVTSPAAMAQTLGPPGIGTRPAVWTILRAQCWPISQTAGQCGVRLIGQFANRDICLRVNGGQLETKTNVRGVMVEQRCEILLQ